MGSNSKEIRESQKQRFEAQLAARKELLVKQGLDDAQQKKDKMLQHLQAEVKRSTKALESIEKLRGTVEGVRKKKLDAAAKAADKGSKKKKKEAAPAKGAKKDKKKKTEKAKAKD